ncbi:zinc finger protein on ecdysone puffs isoform X1 [Drosophila sulfurigaster albostrigata]|uniref:zinc finger protein on ecdysone puffs isoform X1 n=3 Tax=Drosophila sulfurigaster albostrigata TaxID=89887 RepID=UPI002D21904E|nr:zinc finger protein on ecdysone puffs isoform X1 [Drosophila sulfurigaster albostrigata]
MTSVKINGNPQQQLGKGNMAFRGNQNRNRNFGGGGNQYGGPMGANRMGGGGGMNMSPWESQNPGGGGQFGNNMRQGGGGGQMNAQAINNLLNNLFRNQPPSLLDLPRGGMGNRNQRGGPMVNRGGGAGNRLNNRRGQGGFQNRGVTGGPKPPQKQGAGGIRKQNAFDRAKKLLAKNANTNKKKEITPGEKKIESSATPKESPYASVPNDMFYCHLCKKHMWDANSFENHIKGRTHLMMREGIEESYRLKANMIRQEAKLAEQLKSIEFDRLKRMGKSKQRQLDYCTMCDLNFHGHISTHRKSEGHLQLKKFLHPKCVECNKEFATRIDYDTHLLSADHLKKAAENNTKVGERKRQTLPISTAEEETRDLRPPQKRKKKPIKKEGEESTEVKKEPEEGAEGEEAEGEEAKEGEEAADETKEGEDLNESQEEEEVALPVDAEDCILDFAEGDEIPSEVDTRLPKYNWQRPVGAALISKLECFECAVCSKFFDTEITAEIHSRTATHHRNFLKFINEKSSDTKIAQKRAAAAIEENERKKRKVEESEAPAAEGAGDEAAEGAEGELYDPSEATGDDEDFEMNENAEGEEEGGEEAAGEDNGDEMDAQEEEEEEAEAEPEPEPEPEPTPVPTPAPVAQPATPAKPEPAAKPAAKAAPATPAAAATPTPAAATTPAAPAAAATPAAATPEVAPSPAKKPRAVAAAAAAAAAASPAAGPKATPQRNRARGRYNRY